MYAHTSPFAHSLVRFALKRVDLVVPGSPRARAYLHDRFAVPMARMHCGGLWALDRERCRPASATERVLICGRYGIHPDATVVMNVRRFFPAWGSDLALEAFLQCAPRMPSAHFVMLGGAGTDAQVEEARRRVTAHGLSSRFTICNGDLPVADCSALMSITAVAVSVMREVDMRPFASILEAASCGAALVIGDQAEYRDMEQCGFRALFSARGDVPSVVSGLERLISDMKLRDDMTRANKEYLDVHEDGVRQALELLRRMRQVCDGYTRRRVDTQHATQ
jgi:glycosyltransferase involved in cell wall biosynthesis